MDGLGVAVHKREQTADLYELVVRLSTGQSSIRPYWRCYYANTQVRNYNRSTSTTNSLTIPPLLTFPPSSLSSPSSSSQAIIYVIDSSDTSRLPTSRSELLTMLSEDELKNVPVLVFANKQVRR